MLKQIFPRLNTMMGSLRIVILVWCMALTACVTSSEKLSQVSIGMTKAEVVAILGKPQSVSARADGTELLRYQLSGRDAPPLNPNAKRFSDGYTVQFSGGKVVAYGRDDEFQAIDVRVRSAK